MSYQSISLFGLVGLAAAATHYIVAVFLESLTVANPAIANLLGFIVAFPVSYLGHRYLSFKDTEEAHSRTLPRFFLIALSAFVMNQCMLLATLQLTTIPFWLALAAVLTIVAAATFLLSRFWVFRRKIR